MRTIPEMNANDLSVCLCKMADPAERLLSDEAVREAIDNMREHLKDKVTIEKAFSLFTTILYPVLAGDAHKDDTFAVLAALDDVTVEEIGDRNGLEVMRDMFRAFVINTEIVTIFRPCAEVRGE